MEVIVSEKDNAARRIADILSGGAASTEQLRGVNTYAWDSTKVVGLSGHIVTVDFPDEYSDWNKVDPSALITADIVKTPTRQDIADAIQDLARDATRVVIATDYDREGELIGKEAYDLIRETNDAVPIERVRFSSLTENEVTNAFANPTEIDFDLAAAGEARQIIDLIWGAALTRFLSLAAKQYGEDFISVGRVQSPTLKLIVDREQEIEAFDPEDYWELFTVLSKNGDAFEAQYYYLDADDNEADRIWDETEAQAVTETLERTPEATVTEVVRRTRTDTPPPPFNTTQFIRAAGAIGFGAKRAMSIAEDLYTAGYITYPRTDNTVYPNDLDPAALLGVFTQTTEFGEDATMLLDGDLTPTRGDSETTDHPPIHPTGDIPNRGDLSNQEWRVYELVVRRFFATLAAPAKWEHLRVVARAAGLGLKANGRRLADPGYHAVYPYFKTDENYVPDVEEDETLRITEVRLEDKQTQPPRRYGQSRLIETMEEMGIGTKCLTGDTRVLVRGASGVVEPVPVRELFDQERVVMADGDADIAVAVDGPTTIAYHEPTGTLGLRSHTLVSRRPLRDDEHVLRVTTPRGSFAVTADHPVYVRQDDRITLAPAEALAPGDRLVATSRPMPGRDDSHLTIPGTVPVTDVTEVPYDGPVYDLTIDADAPNFAVEPGVIVHNSTRHETIQKLYDRGYTEGDPPRPTQLARGVIEAASEYADLVVSEAMTAQLEADMAAIASGEKTLEEVTEESRGMLDRVFEELEPSREEIGEYIREKLKQDKTIGPCPDCGEQLLVRKSRYGSFFIGCDGYPDCEHTLPLPNKGTPLILENICDEHDLQHVKMLAGRGTFVHGCPQCKADEAEAEEDRVIGECPECHAEHAGELAVKRLRSGSRLVGCTRYPDCRYSLPLPRRGDLEILSDRCQDHDLPEIVIHNGDEPWELGCPICNYESYKAEQASRDGLRSIKGIGKKTAEKLKSAGVETVEDLKSVDAEQLAGSVDGVSTKQIEAWKANA